MAEQYKSNYTGQEIDAGIEKANLAVQPGTLQAALANYQELLRSGVNIKTINNNSLLGEGNIDIQSGGSNVAIKELDFSNPADFDSEGEPTQAAMLDVIENKYLFIHIYNIPINEDVLVETYLIANNMANLENENNIRYYFKFDEGDEDEGTSPNIEQYIFSIEDGQAQLVVENYNLGGSGGSSSWGSITGTLSNQIDLQNALDSKGTYSKPNNGIPENDLSSEVQAKLNAGGGTEVQANPTLVGNESTLLGIQVGNTKYKVNEEIKQYQPDSIDLSNNEITFDNDDLTEILSQKNEKISVNIDENSGEFWVNFKKVLQDDTQGAESLTYVSDVIPTIDSTMVLQTLIITITNDNGTTETSIYLETSPTELAELSDDSTHRLVTDTEKTTWNNKGTYSKPSDGIPENDLSSEVQAKLNEEIADVVLDSNLVGKKLSLIGDSITTYSGWLPSGNASRYPRGAITNVEQTWWKKLLNATGMVIGQNCAWDGSTCSGLSTSTTNAYAACSDKRISQLGLNGTPDIIICYIGINDWGATYNKNRTQYGGSFVDGAFVPVGDYTGESALPSGELKTFSEAYGCMIGKIQNQYPNAKIYCCTLPQTNGKATYNYDADGAFPSINRDGVSIADYNDCIRMLANNFGVETIEFAKCGIHWGNITTYMEDGLHPRPDGMTLLANTAKAKLYNDFGVSVHGGSPTPTPSTDYTITNNLTHVTTNNSATSVTENASYIATLTPESTYNLQSVTVEMGGVDITSTAYSNGTITIVNVTGNLVITATGNAITYTVTNNLTNATNSNSDTSAIEGSNYVGTITADSGYELDTVTVTMGGTDITSTAYNNGTINIASVTGNIVITVTTEQDIPITWYTNYPQTGRSGFVDSSRGWALHPDDYQAAYGVPINRISFSAASGKTSGTLNICTAKYNEKTNFSNIQNINWDSSNMNGNVVTVAIDEITLANDDYLCFFVQNASNGTPAYVSGDSAGRFYSYVGQNQNWNTNNKYSFQANLGYKPSSNNE